MDGLSALVSLILKLSGPVNTGVVMWWCSGSTSDSQPEGRDFNCIWVPWTRAATSIRVKRFRFGSGCYRNLISGIGFPKI